MNRTGSAHWGGDLKTGKGTVSTQTTTLNHTPYSFSSRFEAGQGTNPEELLGAAHAGCFSMALSGVLGGHNLNADSIDTIATVTIAKDGDGFSITKVHLDVTAAIPGATDEAFQSAAADAKAGCPVSKLFAGAEITMTAKLA